MSFIQQRRNRQVRQKKQEYKLFKITGNEKGKVDIKLYTKRQNRREQIKPLQSRQQSGLKRNYEKKKKQSELQLILVS